MPLDVSFATPQNRIVPSQVKCFGHIVLDMKDGDSLYGVEDSISSNGSGESSIADEILESPRSSCIHKVKSTSQGFFPDSIGALEIQFSKPSFRYTSGQWIFINVPAVARWQWHPFTITSCPSDPYVSIHIRHVGDFTKRLGQVLGTQATPEGVESALANGRNMPTFRVDGPFGAPAEDVLDNEIAVLVGAGIGVTPWASVLKHILSQFKTAHPPQRLRRVEFIWYTP
jgi:predicted ferric reductase